MSKENLHTIEKQLKNLSYKVKWRSISLLFFSNNSHKTGKIPVLGKPTHMTYLNGKEHKCSTRLIYFVCKFLCGGCIRNFKQNLG